MRKIGKIHILLLFASLVFTLVCMELGLRLIERLNYYPGFFKAINSAYTPFDVKTGEGLYYTHPYTAYDMKPGYGIPGEVTINSYGFRGKEFDITKAPGTFRIVALGGSTTYGIGLEEDGTYPYHLEKVLQERLGTDKVEVINAGLVSATTAESLSRFLLKVVPLDPDMVIFYEGYNDLPPRMFNDYSGDYYHFRKIPDYKPPFLSRFLLYRIAVSGFKASLHYPNTTLLSHTWKFENLPEEESERIENFNNTSTDTYKRNLSYIIDFARARDITIVLSTFGIDDDAPDWNDHMPEELWAKGIGENNAAVTELAEEYDLPLIEYYEYGLRNKDVFLDSIHMTSEGNEKMANFFAGTLVPIIRDQLAAGNQQDGEQ